MDDIGGPWQSRPQLSKRYSVSFVLASGRPAARNAAIKSTGLAIKTWECQVVDLASVFTTSSRIIFPYDLTKKSFLSFPSSHFGARPRPVQV